MALTSFLNVNGYDFPAPVDGFNYIISTTVNAGRNSNNAVVGQRVGRDIYKLNTLEWVNLDPAEWQMMLKALEPFYVPVTFEDYRTGQPITIVMYPGDRTGQPLKVNELTFQVEKYKSCKFNLVDAGRE